MGCQERQLNIQSAGTYNNPGTDSRPTVVVYYFHRTARCPSCLTIESYAAQVMRSNFQEQIEDGILAWKPFNLDDPGGEEFIREFDITFNTIVVARQTDGNHIEYKRLDNVWQLLNDYEEFSRYVTDEIIDFLNDM
jgi:hypothetical protein